MKNWTEGMALLHVGLVCTLLFQCLESLEAKNKLSLLDDGDGVPYFSGDIVEKESLNNRGSVVSGNDMNAEVQSRLNIDSVSDAKPINDDELSAKMGVDNFEALLANLDKHNGFETLFANTEKVFAITPQANEAQKELTETNAGSSEERKAHNNFTPKYETTGRTGNDGENPEVLHQDSLFTSKDVSMGLQSASVGGLEQAAQNVTLLDKMRTLMGYEGLVSSFGIFDSLDWFDDTSTVKSRIRRASEPYHYRRFQQPLRAYIPENSPSGTKVLEIPRNFDGLLEIVSPENPIFRFRSGTGILETFGLLDFETQKVYKLIIRDSDRNDSSFYSHDVIVYVTDENDNEPEFAMTSVTGHVNTASRVGSFVKQLNASDPDTRERGRLGFLIGDRNSPFTVNPRTWIMETNGKPLDPSETNFPVNMRVFDQGYPRKESPTLVVSVNKANNPPVFSQSEYRFTYSETMLPGVVIGRVMATSLSNIPVSYEVVPRSEVFGINELGELSLKRSVDYETAGSLATATVTIRASELTDSNPLSSDVSVTLVVTNYDENPSTFTEAIYNAQIDEDVGIGTFVTSVTVMDCDCALDCRCTGNELDFTLLNENGFFDVSETGEIRTAKLLDYEIQSVHEFAVVAWDRSSTHGDSEPARAYVSVKLRDINNNAPRFTGSPYRFLVDEDSEVGHLVGVVQATDKDNLGSPLTYRITNSSPRDGLFRIPDSRFGIVVVASSLKAETESVFTLTVECSDGVQSSQTTLEVGYLLCSVYMLSYSRCSGRVPKVLSQFTNFAFLNQ